MKTRTTEGQKPVNETNCGSPLWSGINHPAYQSKRETEQTEKPAHTPSAGAMRATDRIVKEIGVVAGGTKRALTAQIIDRETAHAELVVALDWMDATAVNLHCALQSTACMDPNDKRIAVITGEVVRDLLVMRDKARAVIARHAK